MTSRLSTTSLLRIAAFLIDAIAVAMLLLPVAAGISYWFVWSGGPINRIGLVWWAALAGFVVVLLVRDVPRRRSPGKRIMALRIQRMNGGDLSRGAAVLRNLPLVVPGWNLVEVAMLLFAAGGRRSGDRITRSAVVEE